MGGAWNFFIQGHESHALYQNLVMNSGETDKVYTFDTGYRTTNSTANGTSVPTGAAMLRMKYGVPIMAVSIWVMVAMVLSWHGNICLKDSRGGIVCIGSGCYDWYAYGIDASADKYHGNVAKLTENAIDYLTGK